ncbi:MAG: hypothetical protein EZS28_029589 [Streblomastix strix]|uniref:Uncharacterized protein n=1 Tax=Streblomastix strix TaxID=222440 RepID=A0A5J4UW07_9EUKA|nr:MAG: hypothetical protein EZS28_029589 [Streblomastix strix]
MVGADDQGYQSNDVHFEIAQIQFNNGCSDNRMGSGNGVNGGDEGIASVLMGPRSMRNCFPKAIAMIVNSDNSIESTDQDVNDGGLLDQTGSTKRSCKPVRTSCMVGRIRDKNELTIAKVLQLVSRQMSLQNQRTEHELIYPKFLVTSTIQFESSFTDEIWGDGSKASRGVSGEESSDGGSESTNPTRDDETSYEYKRSVGEELFKRMARRVGLDRIAANNVIESSNMGTRRKRRAGLHVFCVYQEEKNVNLDEMLKRNQMKY